MTAILTLDQVGLPAGTTNEARDDGLSTGAVMSATASGYVSTYRMELLWCGQHGTPDTTSEASFAPTGAPGVYSWTPTIDAIGTWLVRLVTDEGTPDQDEIVLGLAVKTAPSALRIPAPQERGDSNASLELDGAAQKRASWFNKPEVSGPFSGPGGTWAPWWRPYADLVHSFNTGAGGTYVPTSRALTASAGLSGGGTLAADRSFAVGANADGSIIVNADDIQVGVLASDAQHGVRGGGTQHSVAVADGAAGFMSGSDKTKLNELSVELVYVSVTGTTKTLALSDRQTIQSCTNAAGCTLTWPGSTFNDGTVIGADQEGAAQVTVAGSGGITPTSSGSELKTARQLARIWMDQKSSTNVRVTGEKSA